MEAVVIGGVMHKLVQRASSFLQLFNAIAFSANQKRFNVMGLTMHTHNEGTEAIEFMHQALFLQTV